MSKPGVTGDDMELRVKPTLATVQDTIFSPLTVGQHN
jgi:hypothetical protein